MTFNLPSPLPETVVDSEDLRRFFRDTDIVPYYGTTEESSHSMLKLLTTLCEVSPTFQTVRVDLEHYTFGLAMNVRTAVTPGIDDEEAPPVLPAAKAMYLEGLARLGLRPTRLLEALRTLDGHMDICGNGWLRVRRVNTPSGGVYSVTALHYNHVAYLVSEDAGEQFLLYSKFLGDLEKMRRFPPLIVRASEQDGPLKWTATEPGTEETIVHLWRGNINDESDYYARPRILSVLPWLFTDYQVGNLSAKISATDFVAKHLLFFQAPDPNRIRDVEETADGQRREIDADGHLARRTGTVFQENMRTLKQLTTNMGGNAVGGQGQAASTFAGIEYPYGGTPPTVVPLEANRDTNSHKFQKEQAIQNVCSALAWSPELVGLRETRTNLGGNLLYDILVMRDVTTIAPRQKRFEDVLNNVLRQLAEREGLTAMQRMELALPNVVAAVSERIFSKGHTGETVLEPSAPNEQAQGNEQAQ